MIGRWRPLINAVPAATLGGRPEVSPSAVAVRAVQPSMKRERWPKPDPSHCPENGGQIKFEGLHFPDSVRCLFNSVC